MTDARNGTDQAVRVAVVGLGYWGPNLVRTFFELPGSELVAVCDLDAERLEQIRQRYPDVRRTTSFDELLDDPAIEGVAIATGVSSHFELARAALEAGKHVLVEKPMAASSREASGLIALAEERNLVLMPGHTFLYSPPVDAVRDLIRSGELGDIYFVSSSRVNLGLHQPDVSVVWDLGPHDFSILRYWLDQTPITVSALSRSCVFPTTPDVTFINLQFPSGTIAHVELAWLAPSKLRRTAVVGSQKMVTYDDTSNEPVRIFDSGVSVPDPKTFGEYKLTYRTGPIVSPQIDATEPLMLEIGDFCAAVRGLSAPRSSATLGLDVVRLIEAATLSIESSGMPVDVAGATTQDSLGSVALNV